MPFKNKIRLPFHLSRPQYPVEETIYRRTDGTRRVQKSIVSKEMEGRTDWMPEKIHERLTIALRHDIVNIYNDNFTGPVRINGAYEIAWIEDREFPVAPAKFKAFDEDFQANNSTCATCDDLDQMELIDDAFVQPLDQGGTYLINVAANDSLCCTNPVFSIVSFDPAIIANAAITQLGILTITLQPNVVSQALSEILRYRVACGDMVQDAGVSAAITGTGPAVCQIPTGPIEVIFDPADPMPIAAIFSWSAAFTPAFGWWFELYSMSNQIETLVTSGVVGAPTITINALTAGRDFRFKLYSRCTNNSANGGDSSPLILNFKTPTILINAGNATVVVTVTGVPDGSGKEQLIVRAEIQQNVTFNEPINVQGVINLQGNQFGAYPFNFDIVPGTPWAEEFLFNVSPGWWYTMTAFMGSPDSVSEFGAPLNIYNLSFIY